MIEYSEISAWLQTEAGVPAERADRAAREIAGSWNDGDHEYQTVKDILGGYLTDDEPRPKLLADNLATAFDIVLEG